MKMSTWDIFVNNLWSWKKWLYPVRPTLPVKPWHPDGDTAFTKLPKERHPLSALMIAHLKDTDSTSGGFTVCTGSTIPNSGGKVDGYPLNLAKASNPKYTISKVYAPAKVWISTGWASAYDKVVRYVPSMMIQGNPMQDYSDHKLHVFDPVDRTITELGEFYDRGSYYLQARKATQYSLDCSSWDAVGCSVAGLPLSELTLRYENIISQGWCQRASMGVVAASTEFVWPAVNSDGQSTEPDAPPVGAILKLKESARTRLTESGFGRGVCPQANAVMDCYSGPGIMIVDSGGHNTTMLEPDSRWDQKDLSALKQLTIDDFEVWTL